MTTHYFYIIYSAELNKYYLGETSNLESRIIYHNEKTGSKGFSKSANDWEYVLQYKCESKLIAQKLERFVKSQKSRHFNLRIIEDTEILTNIIETKLKV
jgi:putative endonuclease